MSSSDAWRDDEPGRRPEPETPPGAPFVEHPEPSEVIPPGPPRLDVPEPSTVPPGPVSIMLIAAMLWRSSFLEKTWDERTHPAQSRDSQSRTEPLIPGLEQEA